jgi:phytoene dehydrogenase-like protein
MRWQGDQYDVIILGSGLGGLIAGVYLLKEQRRVLLLKENQYHPFSEEIGYRFVPFSNFSERRMKALLLKRVSRELDCSLFVNDRKEMKKEETKLIKQNQNVSFQVILPRARIDLFDDHSRLQIELKREFPKEIAQIENFYQQMESIKSLLKNEKTKGGPESVFPIQPRRLVRKWWPFRTLPNGKMDERLAPFSAEFKEFIRFQLISWGNLFSAQFPISLANYIFFHDETDEWISETDLEDLKEKVLEKFIESGGKIEGIDGLKKVEKKWRKGVILLTKEEEKEFRSQFVILNSPLYHLSDLMAKKGRELSKWVGKIQPRYMLIPLFLGIHEKVVPVGMKDLLVSILDLSKPYEGGNLLFLSLSPKGDETKAPIDRRALTVESLSIPGKWSPDLFIEHRKGVMKHLNHLFPFLEEHIEYTDWDWANKQCPCWSYPHFYYEITSDFRWRKGVVPNRISKRFYFVGKENFPYLGIEGEVLSGLMVARQILKEYS